mmetsp:Transcript_16110/g.37350  ORF Transcript_16110/g.37350 Transcript_16110/m.37350 type:complete len:203 (-) Transcript_16110:3176-3784(-)
MIDIMNQCGKDNSKRNEWVTTDAICVVICAIYVIFVVRSDSIQELDTRHRNVRCMLEVVEWILLIQGRNTVDVVLQLINDLFGQRRWNRRFVGTTFTFIMCNNTWQLQTIRDFVNNSFVVQSSTGHSTDTSVFKCFNSCLAVRSHTRIFTFCFHFLQKFTKHLHNPVSNSVSLLYSLNTLGMTWGTNKHHFIYFRCRSRVGR